MKVNVKNTALGLIMLAGGCSTFVACSQQKNNKEKTSTENVITLENTIKNYSDSTTAEFKATRLRQKADSIIKTKYPDMDFETLCLKLDKLKKDNPEEYKRQQKIAKEIIDMVNKTDFNKILIPIIY